MTKIKGSKSTHYTTNLFRENTSSLSSGVQTTESKELWIDAMNSPVHANMPLSIYWRILNFDFMLIDKFILAASLDSVVCTLAWWERTYVLSKQVCSVMGRSILIL